MTIKNNGKSALRGPYLISVPGRPQLHIRDGKARISTGETDRGAATAVLIEYIDKKKRQAELDAAAASATATLRDILDVWAAKRQTENGKTWDNKWKYIHGAIRLRAGDTPLHQIDDDWAARYERGRSIDDGVSEPTVRQELSTILTAWRLASTARPKVTTLPVPVFDLPAASDPHDTFLTRAEADRLIDAAKTDYMRLFIRLGLATAGRHEAILQLTWDRVNLGTGVIDLRCNVVDLPAGGQDRDTRGRKIRAPRQKPRAQVRVEGVVLDELHLARASAVTPYVIEYRGQPIGRVHKGFAKVVESAGLAGRGITPHIMRHTAITWLMQSGADIYQVAGFAGHRDIKMILQRYGHHHPDFQSGLAATLSQTR